jgi:hypothetical protein
MSEKTWVIVVNRDLAREPVKPLYVKTISATSGTTTHDKAKARRFTPKTAMGAAFNQACKAFGAVGCSVRACEEAAA